MRNSRTLKQVLGAFLETPGGEHYGFDLMKRAGVASGTLYPILERLEREGWAESTWEKIDPSLEGRPRRRVYRLTGLGVTEATERLTVPTGWGVQA